MNYEDFNQNTKYRGNDPLSLEDLMYKYGTDKSKDDHKYSDLYAMLFDPIRGKVRNVLEVGVSTGQSLKVWHDYFPDAAIYGVDKFNTREQEKVQAELDLFKRVQIFKADSQQKEAVDTLGLTPNSMDIVIDDGDHTFVGQERTLHVMWPYVRPGGYYMIEDVEWDRGGDPKLYPILHAPWLYFQPRTLEILKANDAFFADTALGHRNWDLWQKRATTSWVVDRFTHNSHVVVLRKRVTPLRPVSINLGVKAMKWSSPAPTK